MKRSATDCFVTTLLAMTGYDLAVVGGGPAGAAAAIAARQAGLSTVVIARARGNGVPVGECLSPAAAVTLRQLGLSTGFLNEQHRPCYGYASCWGSAELQRYDFIRDPRGHGWHIDRELFEAELRNRAQGLGAEWCTTKQACDARVIIDATGRAAAVARRQGARRVDTHRQVAQVTLLDPTHGPPADTTTWVEAVEHGWWYSGIIPSGRMVIVLFTDKDLLGRTSIDDTTHMRRRIVEGGYRPIAPPKLVAAGGSRLSEFAGRGWFAAGDAAMSFDPLSGHGIAAALQSGHDAALAAAAWLGGDASAPSRYQSMLVDAYARYAELRQVFYRREARWPDAPYWRRRR